MIIVQVSSPGLLDTSVFLRGLCGAAIVSYSELVHLPYFRNVDSNPTDLEKYLDSSCPTFEENADRYPAQCLKSHLKKSKFPIPFYFFNSLVLNHIQPLSYQTIIEQICFFKESFSLLNLILFTEKNLIIL